MGCLKLEILEKNDSLKVTFRAKNSAFLGDLDYYPFGMQMPGRSFSSTESVYGYNGMLKDDEITNQSGGNYTAAFWEYDPRLGRRWNQDPINYAWQSPYATLNNNPVVFTDPMGLEGEGSTAYTTVTQPVGTNNVVPNSSVSNAQFGKLDLSATTLGIPEVNIAPQTTLSGGFNFNFFLPIFGSSKVLWEGSRDPALLGREYLFKNVNYQESQRSGFRLTTTGNTTGTGTHATGGGVESRDIMDLLTALGALKFEQIVFHGFDPEQLFKYISKLIETSSNLDKKTVPDKPVTEKPVLKNGNKEDVEKTITVVYVSGRLGYEYDRKKIPATKAFKDSLFNATGQDSVIYKEASYDQIMKKSK
jgi:RHS repeat-associated protein